MSSKYSGSNKTELFFHHCNGLCFIPQDVVFQVDGGSDSNPFDALLWVQGVCSGPMHPQSTESGNDQVQDNLSAHIPMDKTSDMVTSNLKGS